MLELGVGADFFRLITRLYLLLIIVGIVGALWLAPRWWQKILWVVVVLAVLVGQPLRNSLEDEKKRQAHRARYEASKVVFDERCKGAGIKIYRTAEDVEGLFLLKQRIGADLGKELRPKAKWDPNGPLDVDSNAVRFLLNDPYGFDLWGDGYIGTFLKARNEKGFLTDQKLGGYGFVDAIDPTDGVRYRYTGRIDQPWLRDKKRYPEWRLDFVLDKVPAPDPAPRYGVTFDDISTLEDREHWIAGSSLRVIDLQTGEVMAERIGYMMDPGQGARGRQAWDRARDNACPAFPRTSKRENQPYTSSQARRFVEQVLKPRLH